MTEQKNSKALHTTLWVVQGLLAAAFGMAGFMKMTAPIAQLAANGMTFVNQFSIEMVRFIGVAEVLGAIGLILPAALRIKPVLTPLAAVGVAIIMVLAAIQHITSNEPIFANIVLFALAVFVAWGRFVKVPIQAK
ncbi:MAG: DoxX family protein [Bacteroidetes Order II. Incertae sedis bacterium]|nr:DoxX family protein [Bacteroidetes Order II. bacterium]